MKRLFFVTVYLFLMAACQEVELPVEKVSADADFYSTMEEVSATKTSMDQNNNVIWSEGDQIAIFKNSTQCTKYQVKSSCVGSTTGSFSEVPESNSGDFESGQWIDHNVVLYPYSSALSCLNIDENSYALGITVPEVQYYAENTFGNGSFPMVAVSADNRLTFKNVYGGVKLQFKGVDKIKSIVLEGLDSQILAGEGTVTAYVDKIAPSITMSSNGSKNITLDCGEGVQLNETAPTVFIISVPPVAFPSGMKITVTDTDGMSRTLVNRSSMTITRSRLLSFPLITYTQNEIFEIPEGSLESITAPSEGGQLELKVVTNQDYDVVIPDHEADWIRFVGTKAIREETIVLEIDENDTPEARSAEIHIDDVNGTLQSVTIEQGPGVWVDINDLSAVGTANSYIVSSAGAYQFTPTKGNTSESVGVIASVEVLWETFGTDVQPLAGDLVLSARYSNGVIKFRTPSDFKEGNALIAAKDEAGTVLWSWHIWFTDQPEEQVYYQGAGTMMDRNLGAVSAAPGDVGALGLLYQWGRKDPFIGSSSISESFLSAKSTLENPKTVTSDSNTGTIDYAVANPTTLIDSNRENYDWLYGTIATERWTDLDSPKSVYDPCPAGWRVPNGEVWQRVGMSNSTHTFDNVNKGMDFSGLFGDDFSIWYPYTGSSRRNGYPDNAGIHGLYTSASASEFNQSMQLDLMDDGSVRLVYAYNESANPVRCLKENSQSAEPLIPEVPDTDAFDENRFIVYNHSYEHSRDYVLSGDSFWKLRPFFLSRVSTINEIELKFQMASEEIAYLFYSERPYVNNGVLINSDGIVLRWNNRESITNERVLTWEEVGIPSTVKIVMNISVSKHLVTINGKEFTIPELGSFTNIGYLFSSYYYENDDGYAKTYTAVPTGSKLYYAKVWDTSGNLTYHGYAAQGEYTDGSEQFAWKSECGDDVTYEFARTNFASFWVYSYTSGWSHFEGNVDTDTTPIDCIVFENQEIKDACVAAFDKNGDNELSYSEASAVTYLSSMTFPKSVDVSFGEFACFTSVTTIPEEYFKNSMITSISFPRSLEEIGQYAFRGCTKLKSLSLPENIRLGYGAFHSCESLTELTIPSGINWTTDVFRYCTGLQKVTINSGVEYIPDCAFSYCTQLTSVTIPSTVTKLWSHVFDNCTSLSNITIPDSVTEMLSGAFYGCTNLKNVKLSANIITLPGDTFYKCSSLTSIVIPNKVTEIGGSCFYECSSLTSIALPKSVTKIGYGTFSNCTSLTTVSVKSETPPSLSDYVFDSCSSLSKIYVPSSSQNKYQNATYWYRYSSMIYGTTFN